MSKLVKKVDYHHWQHPSNIMVCGPTKSGKTQFVYKLLRHRNWLFRPGVKKVLFIFSEEQKIYDQMKDEFGDSITFVQGIPDDPYTYFKPHEHGVIVVDDMMCEIERNAGEVSKWFTKGTHHKNISLVLLVQNLFPKNMRNISLNAHYLVLFQNPIDKSQASRLGAQVFPGDVPCFKTVLQRVFRVPYRPVILNFHHSTPTAESITCDLFPEDLQKSGNPFPQVFIKKQV